MDTKTNLGFTQKIAAGRKQKTAARISPNSGSYVSMFILQATSVLLAGRKGTAL